MKKLFVLIVTMLLTSGCPVDPTFDPELSYKCIQNGPEDGLHGSCRIGSIRNHPEDAARCVCIQNGYSFDHSLVWNIE